MEHSSNRRGRVFPQEFKLAVVMRMREGEAVSALARELGIRRKVLYGWKQAFAAGGEAALARGVGRPPGGGGVAPRSQPPAGEKLGPRVAELERLIGRQQALIDFFERALSAIGHPPSGDAGKAPSTKPSGPRGKPPGRR
jgi:transposase